MPVGSALFGAWSGRRPSLHVHPDALEGAGPSAPLFFAHVSSAGALCQLYGK